MSDPKKLYAVMVPTSYGHDLQCTLVEDTGEALSRWISSNKHWGRRDLLAELGRKHDPATRFPDGYEVVEADRWSDLPEAVLQAYRAQHAEQERADDAPVATPDETGRKNGTTLKVGDLRKAMEGMPDDAQMFVTISGQGEDFAVKAAWQSLQIPEGVKDWRNADQVFGLEIHLGLFEETW